ncbi:hypothetical protein PSHT_16126 [Puccinia striiformis]|uniref:Uncharacterized protein n=1 Tax=Puccinia striiformis TaxID=27350 RepID=A0A2S4UBK0_9BASI|nr:hypothetical protein PSHT_16126 [Puccinia striiformis]
MQICRLITILGFCLSQALAHVGPELDAAIKSFVLDLAEPNVRAGQPIETTKFNDALHDQLHGDNPRETRETLFSKFKPFQEGHELNAAAFADSRANYDDTLRTKELKAHPKLLADRLDTYRNSMYSRLFDILDNENGKFNAESLATARQELNNLLSNRFPEESKYKTITSYPDSQMAGFKYLTMEQVDKALKETNVPDAKSINGEATKGFKSFINSHLIEKEGRPQFEEMEKAAFEAKEKAAFEEEENATKRRKLA